MPIELFGISIGRAKKEALSQATPVEKKAQSFVLPDLDDAMPVDAGGYYGIVLTLMAPSDQKHNLLQNIVRWRCTLKLNRLLKIFVMNLLF